MEEQLLYYPVVSRVKLALQDNLKLIKRVNGYSCDVKHVHRLREAPTRADDPVELFLFFGATRKVSEVSKGTNNRVYERMSVRVSYFDTVMDTAQQDLSSDLIVSDIQKAVPCWGVEDRRHGENLLAEGAGRLIQVELISSQPSYSVAQGQTVLGNVDFHVFFFRMRDNPYLWDDDDILVPINQVE